MVRKLLVIVSLTILFISCKKASSPSCPYTESSAVAPAGEIASLQAYITANHPLAVQHPSGIFYEIGVAGSGSTPTVCSAVTVKYAGYLTNNYNFETNTTGYSNYLGALVLGWQKGIPLIKTGGSITLYIPPSLGYGSQEQRNNAGVVIIPANSILIFTIQLVSVQ